MPDGLYDSDILAWSETQADLLRRVASGQRVNGVDWEHVVEEIADVGLSQLSAVNSLLRQAILHLLKGYLWPDDPGCRHWRTEIGAFLDDAADRFAPSMRQRIDVAKLWRQAKSNMARGNADDQAFVQRPDACPWTLDDLLANDHDLSIDRLPRSGA